MNITLALLASPVELVLVGLSLVAQAFTKPEWFDYLDLVPDSFETNGSLELSGMLCFSWVSPRRKHERLARSIAFSSSRKPI